MQAKKNIPPRFTELVFPDYRYVPNKNPHPVIHPEGHSFGRKEAKIERIQPEDWQTNTLYLYGIDLFNFGYWWEAHEAWESLWLSTKKFDLEGQYLQGLIQMSAALLKLYQGTPKSFFKLFNEAYKRLDFCLIELETLKLKNFMGLDLKNWLEKITQFKIKIESEHVICLDATSSQYFPWLIPTN